LRYLSRLIKIITKIMNTCQIYNKKYELYREYYNPYLLAMVPNGLKVLDVGCSGGQFGKYLVSEKECIVFGVDISDVAITEAKKHLHAACTMDIEYDSFPFDDERFDLIIFGDVLEHLREPSNVLHKFKKYLKPDGRILASIPNVAHIGIRCRLFWGSWNYRPSGILDESHLRFFTLSTAKKLLIDSGFVIIAFKISPGINIKLSRKFPIIARFTNTLCRAFPSLFALQFIFLCSKK